MGTRELFLPAYGHTTGTRGTLGSFSIIRLADETPQYAYFTFKVPDDFVSFISVKAVWESPAASGDMNWELDANYGAAGEAYNTHTDSPGPGTTATGGANIINVQEPASPLTLTLLASGDYVGIFMLRNSGVPSDTLDTYVNLLGLLFTYTD